MDHAILNIFYAATINRSHLTSLMSVAIVDLFIFAPNGDSQHLQMFFRIFCEADIGSPSLIISIFHFPTKKLKAVPIMTETPHGHISLCKSFADAGMSSLAKPDP